MFCFILKPRTLSFTCSHWLLFVFICCTTRCHSMSFIVICCNSLYYSLSLVVIYCHSLYHSLSQIMLAACRRFEMVRISDNGPSSKSGLTSFGGQPFHRNNWTSSSPSSSPQRNGTEQLIPKKYLWYWAGISKYLIVLHLSLLLINSIFMDLFSLPVLNLIQDNLANR